MRPTIELLKIPPFSIILHHNDRIYRLLVEQIELTSGIEKFKVSAGKSSLEFLSLRPQWRMVFGHKSNNYECRPRWNINTKDDEAVKKVETIIKDVIMLCEREWIDEIENTGKGGH